MDKKVIEYFEIKGRDVGKLVKKRPRTVTPIQVHKACEQFFERIQRGEEIKDLLITPIVYAMAKKIDADEYATQIEKLNALEVNFEEEKNSLQGKLQKQKKVHISIETAMFFALIYMLLNYLGIL